MNSLLSLWPLAFFVAILIGLVVVRRTGYTRPPLPVITSAQLPRDDAEMVMMAELVRSGAFYVCGAVLDWKMCCEFASKVVAEAKQEDN